MGAFAMRMGRVAMPLVKKDVLPVAKEFGKSFISGKKRLLKAVRDALKHSANKTIAKASETRGAAAGAGTVATAAGGGSGGRAKRHERAGDRAPQVEKCQRR